MTRDELTHVDSHGAARMVDIGDKPTSRRTAIATATCLMNPKTALAIQENLTSKGDVLQVARIAAIAAAKRTDELIPLCHSVPLDRIDTEFEWEGAGRLLIRVSAIATGKTGVEMEALVGASLAALTIYDMCKAIDREMRIENVQLQSKSGGSRGDYVRT